MKVITYQFLCPHCDEEFTYRNREGEIPAMVRCRLCQTKIMADQFEELGYIFPQES